MTKDKNKETASMELMHALLKQVQTTLAGLGRGQNEIRADLRAVKMQNIETQRQLVVQEGDIAEIMKRLERIEKRLDLVEA